MKKLKCKLCDTIVDFPKKDKITCKCENLTLDAKERVIICAKGESSYCMIDDEGCDIVNEVKPKPTRQELLELLKGIRENIEKLPQEALGTSINHYDLLSLILVLEGLFEAS